MLKYPQIDPVAIHLGPVVIHWYGLMYLLSFVSAWGLLRWRTQHAARGFTHEQLSDIVFYAAIGVIVGGRLGYMIFYAGTDWLAHPLSIVEVWQGGMSFHGGLLGVLVMMAYYAHKSDKHFADITDLIAPVVPIGLGLGRLGNFINGELWGKITEVPWGMVFPHAGPSPRHPSQLYEFLLEGVILFLVLWIYSAKPRPRWAVSGLFLLLYGSFRFLIEFWRVPDEQIGYLLWGWVTEGQVLSLPMILAGLIMLGYAYRGTKQCNNI
jgi:phosphatidylglycerol:prolipoprotein diacylglycerol transferase